MAIEYTVITREEQAALEVGRTDVSSRLAKLVVGLFLLTIFSMAPIQAIREFRENAAAKPEDRKAHLGSEIKSMVTSPLKTYRASDRQGFGRLFQANGVALREISSFETDLKDESFLSEQLITPTQAIMTRYAGLGNEKGYPGKDGWAFFRDGVDYLTGAPFLDPATLEKRAASGNEWKPAPQPDPRTAIIAFHQYLAKRDIQLVVVPAPIKPMVHPDKLSRRYAAGDRVQNASYYEFEQSLQAAGVLVFDPLDLLKENEASYLETDTHWTPAAMELVAEKLNTFIRTNVSLPSMETDYQRQTQTVTNLGDVAATLLKLEERNVFDSQTVTIHPVVDGKGAAWVPQDAADVLLLGDSFANIFSLEEMKWGSHAGFAEQLSFQLQRPLDTILKNDAGAYATREALYQKLHKRDVLAGKKVVIWEFAARELGRGDWKRFDWDGIDIPAAGTTSTEPKASGDALPISGKIAKIVHPPRPGTVTYRDCLVQIHLTDVKGLESDTEILLNLHGMRDNVWTAVASWKEGQTVKLQVEDWETVARPRKLDRIKQLILTDDAVIFLPLFWGEPTPQAKTR